MKDIILPSESSDAIDLGAINRYTKGIIIAYKGEQAVGYINFDSAGDGPWALLNMMNVDSCVSRKCGAEYYIADSLSDLINDIIKYKVANNFKLINFIDTPSSDTEKQ